MTREPDGLAELLPQWHRLRDEAEGGPLRALLAVLAEQDDLIRAGTEQNYRDWFVETAAEWVLPYLGDLVGYRPLPGYERVLAAGPPDGDRTGRDRPGLAHVLASRREVAETVAYRRRKGTLPLLEDLAAATAGWPARAVELSRLVARTQPVRRYGSGLHGPGPDTPETRAAAAADAERRAARGRLVDLRDGAALDLAGTPFTTLSRSADVRRADSRHRQGGYTPGGVAVHVWRLSPHAVTRAPAHCVDRARNLYTFSVLGNDTALVTRPEPAASGHQPATADQVPAAIRRRQLADHLTDYYGPGRSLAVWRDLHGDPVDPADVVVADLSGWAYRPKRGQVAIDPELGRLAFGSRGAPRSGVWVSYHHAFAAGLGGGEYPRAHHTPPDAVVYRVGPDQRFSRITDAYASWRADRAAGRCVGEGVIEITHSGAYQEQLDFALEPADRLRLRAAEGTRPVIRLLDWYSNRPDALTIRAGCPGPDGTSATGTAAPDGPAPTMVLEGLLITGRGVHVTGPVGAVALRHCTLVPGWSLRPECEPQSPGEPSLVLESTSARTEIDRTILGPVEVLGDEAGTDPLALHVRDSVLDATAPDRPALAAPDCRHAHAVLHLHRATVLGEVWTHAVAVGENSVLTGRVHVARRQTGCLRFSWVRPGSRTPRRYRCLPESADHPVRPLFASARYGTASYAQLADGGPEEIRRGSEEGAELGVHHDLYQPQREDNLRARLAEYTPAGTDAGVFPAR